MNLWGKVISQHWQILVSRTGDDTLRVLCCVLCVCSLCVVCVCCWCARCWCWCWCWCVTLTHLFSSPSSPSSPTHTPHKVATPCMDDHQFKEEEMGSVGELSTVCSQIVLNCLYLARIGRPDILWSVNKLAREVTKWTKACDKRLVRLISYIHHTSEYRQYCYVGNTAQECRS